MERCIYVGKWIVRGLILALAILIIGMASPQAQQNDPEILLSNSLRYQIIANTQKIAEMEREIDQLRANGTNRSQRASGDVQVLAVRVENQERALSELKSVLGAIFGFVMIQLAGLAWLGLRHYAMTRASKAGE